MDKGIEELFGEGRFSPEEDGGEDTHTLVLGFIRPKDMQEEGDPGYLMALYPPDVDEEFRDGEELEEKGGVLLGYIFDSHRVRTLGKIMGMLAESECRMLGDQWMKES